MPQQVIDADRAGYINKERLQSLIWRLWRLTGEQVQLRMDNDRWVYNASQPLPQWEVDAIKSPTRQNWSY